MKIENGKWYLNSGGNEVVAEIKGNNFIMKGGLLEYIVNEDGKYTFEGDFPHPYDIENEIQKEVSGTSIFIMCIGFNGIITQKVCNSIPNENDLLLYLYEQYNLSNLTIEYKTDNTYILTDNITINFYEQNIINWTSTPI